MKTYVIPGEQRSIDVPDISAVTEQVMKIDEGPYAGVWFTLTDMVMDDEDECLMHYNVECAGATVDEIKPIVDNFILQLLLEQIERSKNEANPTSNPNT